MIIKVGFSQDDNSDDGNNDDEERHGAHFVISYDFVAFNKLYI